MSIYDNNKELSYAYIASFVDQQGIFEFYVSYSPKKKRTFGISFKMTSVYYPFFVFIKKHFPFLKIEEKSTANISIYKTKTIFYEVRLFASHLDCFLEKIYPYLLEKKKHCELLMEGRKLFQEKYTRGVPLSVVNKRIAIAKKLKNEKNKRRRTWRVPVKPRVYT